MSSRVARIPRPGQDDPRRSAALSHRRQSSAPDRPTIEVVAVRPSPHLPWSGQQRRVWDPPGVEARGVPFFDSRNCIMSPLITCHFPGYGRSRDLSRPSPGLREARSRVPQPQ